MARMLTKESRRAISLALRTRILVLPTAEYRAIGLGMQNVLVLANPAMNRSYRMGDILVLFPADEDPGLSRSFQVRLSAVHRFEDIPSVPFPVPPGYAIAELALV